jgi:hypothetical protein
MRFLGAVTLTSFALVAATTMTGSTTMIEKELRPLKERIGRALSSDDRGLSFAFNVRSDQQLNNLYSAARLSAVGDDRIDRSRALKEMRAASPGLRLNAPLVHGGVSVSFPHSRAIVICRHSGGTYRCLAGRIGGRRTIFSAATLPAARHGAMKGAGVS